MKTLQGVFPPMATPFKNDELDIDGLRSNVTAWMTTRLAGVLVLGSNGEAPMLDADEAYRATVATRECVPADRILIVGAGEESTHATIAAVRQAARAGADFVLVRTPSYFKKQITPDVLYRHYVAVADASPVPVIPYNVPGLTGVSIPPETVARLAAHPNIPGLKDSSGDLTQVAEVVAQTPAGFKVLVGSAPTLYASVCVGASGAIVAAACVVPDLVVELYELARQGRHADARALQQRLIPLAKSVTTGFGVPGLKAALDLVGYAGGLPRQPLPAASPAMIATLRTQFEALGVTLAPAV